MKKLTDILKIVIVLWFTGIGTAFGQADFRVISGIPHLPVIDPVSIVTPETGMLIFSTSSKTPMIYTGAAWENLCTNSVSTVTLESYFAIKGGIPYIPCTNISLPGQAEPGSMFYSKTNNAMMFHDDGTWVKISDIPGSSFTSSPGFSAGILFKLPVLDTDPFPAGLSAGALYINFVTKSIRFYDGTVWQNITCGPVIITTLPTGITSTSAISGGEITSIGSLDVTSQGLCWGLSVNPNIISGPKTTLPGTGIGTFVSSLTNLIPNTFYHVRAYAITSAGGVYGDDKIFKTSVTVPTIITTIASGISNTTANSGGNITSDGGAQITGRGIIWSTIPNPQSDFNAIKTNDGSGVGPFESNLTGLLEITTYYVQAYAANAQGTAYGNVISFTTPPAVAPVLSPSDIFVNSITDISAVGEIVILNNGGSPVTERGILLSTDSQNFITVPSATVNVSDIGNYFSNLNSLSSGITYYVKAYATNKAGTSYSSVTSFITASYVVLTTTPATGISRTSAGSGGEITNSGQAIITVRGVCWSTTRNPSVDLITKTSQSVTGAGTGIYSSYLSVLTPNTVYYFRAYAVNNHGISYGNLDSLATIDYPTIETSPVLSFTSFTANGGGNVTNDGRLDISQRGVCWGTVVNPSIGDGYSRYTSNGAGTGIFTSKLINITPNITYHSRAYATNEVGTVYGADLTFFLDPTIPTITTLDAANITNNMATTGGDLVSSGGTTVTSRGIIWSTMDPLVDPTPVKTIDATTEGAITVNLNNLLGNTIYYVRAYAINNLGTAYGNLVQFTTLPITAPVLSSRTLNITNITNTTASTNFTIISNGGSPVTSRGIIMSTDRVTLIDIPAPVNENSDIGTFINSLTGLLKGTTYYVRGYATNSKGITYTDESIFTTASLANLVTAPVINITGSTAMCGGEVINNTEPTIIAKGICWSTSPNPIRTYDSKTSEQVTGDGLGVFVSSLSGLLPNTTYYVRAYAVNTQGTGYGNQQSFITASLPSLTTTAVSSVTSTTAVCGGNIDSDGRMPVTSRGVCWSSSTSVPDINSSNTKEGTGIGIFTSNLTGLLANTTYYVRAYAVNSVDIAYGKIISFYTGPAALATLTTNLASSITSTTAMSGGTITFDGGERNNTRGVCWSTMTNPTINDSHTNIGIGSGNFTSKLIDLLGSTKYYMRAYVINSAGIAYGDEQSFMSAPPVLSTLTTTAVTDIGGSTATSGGYISSNGGALVTLRGVCWSTSANATMADNYMIAGDGDGSFYVDMTGLTPTTKYYIRAYAINSEGISYGNELIFSTFTTPTLTTSPISSITSTTAVSGGFIEKDGGAIVSSSGICWNITGSPTTTDTHTTFGIGIGDFINNITGLLGSTTYYVRAYATNKAGTAYGNELSFTTAPPVLATLITKTTNSGADGITAYSGGVVSSNGGGIITTTGVCWSTSPNFDPLTVFSNRISKIGSGTFDITITGLNTGTLYYAKAFAVNSAGTAYADNESSFKTPQLATVTTTTPDVAFVKRTSAIGEGNITDGGGATVTSSGLCWSVNPIPTISDGKTTGGTGTGSFIQTISPLMGSTTYFVRAYAINSVGIAYGNTESLTTLPPEIPTLTTSTPVITSATTATVGGNISSDGGAMVTTRGLIWSISPGFDPSAVTANKTAETGYYTGNFTATMNALVPGTVYYVRAYVVNSVGIAYGNEVSFMAPKLATLTTTYASAQTSNTAGSGGNITDDGGAYINTRGVIWSTVADFVPELSSLNKTTDGSNKGSFTSTLTYLTGSTQYYVRAYATSIAGTSYGNQVSITTNPPVFATITTKSAILIRWITSVTAGGYINNDGGAPVTTRGVVWSEFPNFKPDTVVINKTAETGNYTGSYWSEFTCTLTRLKQNTTYYMRAYGINTVGVAYGQELSFTTFGVPTLTTKPITASTTGYTAVSGGSISNTGQSTISDRGICWSTGPNPTIGLFTKTSQGYGSSFTSNLTGLSPVTTYYVKAYAVNDLGLAYGDEVTFTTPPAVPVLSTTYASGTSSSSMLTGGEITSNGGAPITSRGVRWSTIANFNPDLELVNQTIDGAGIGVFVSNITGLETSTRYYVRAYAINSAGIAYGNQVNITLFPTSPILDPTVTNSITGNTATGIGNITSDGGETVTSRGICWNTSTNPTITNSKISSGTGTGSFTGILTGLIPNTIYYVRSYAINNIGTAYGLETTLLTSALPTLTATTAATNILTTTATSGGQITDDGRTPIITRGVCWSIYSSPTTGMSKTIDNTSTGIGSFSAKLTNLLPTKIYYVRAYATNSVGTTYGSEISFTTSDVMLPTVITTAPTNMTSSSVISGGEITDEGGMPVTSRGLIWGIVNPPVTKNPAGTVGTGIFVTSLTVLLPNTKYYVQAYATNSQGTGYGVVTSFTTLVMLPKLSLVNVSGLTITTADGSATVTDKGGDLLSDIGLCWNATGIVPALDNSISNDASGVAISGTAKNLSPGTKYYIWAYATNRAGTAYSASPTFFTTPTLAALTTKAINTITTNSAISGGVIISSGGGTMSRRGVCWSTISPSYVSDSHIDDLVGTASFVSNLTGLAERTTYYVRSYAITSYGTNYGDLLSFTTLSTATLSTNEITSVTSNSAVSGGVITDNGGSQITQWGVCWSTVNPPTTAHSRTNNYSGNSTSFNESITGLLSNTTYFVRAYAFTSQGGTSYGTLQSFTTLGAVPTLSAVTISNPTSTSANASATVTATGGGIITERGFRWNITGIAPTDSDITIRSDIFAPTIIGTLNYLTAGTKYYVWAYATSNMGTGYSASPASFTTSQFVAVTTTKPTVITGNSASSGGIVTYDGGATVTARGLCWSTSDAPTIANNLIPCSSGIGSFTGSLTGLTGGTIYYVRAYATNSAGTSYGNTESFTTLTTPSLTTTPVTAITYISAVSGGSISSDGGAPVTARGVCWSTTSLPVSTGLHTQSTTNGIGDFTCNITGLATVTSYYVRAYATSTQGTSYGNEVLLTALPVPPTVSVLTISNLTSTTADWSASVTFGGGAAVTERGLCWSIIGLPTISDNLIPSGSGIGPFNDKLTGLVEGPTYYLSAYATNAGGTAYGLVQTFKICPTFTVMHKTASGAPVDKTITYSSVNTSVSGSSLCWLTKNLGAELEPASATDIAEEPMGWYWQFNRSQGYQNITGGMHTPVPWLTSITEGSDWVAANDPCLLELGPGWRLPTNTEWTNADAAPQYWVKAADAYGSVLKLHNAGYLNTSGTLSGRGTGGYYWSSTQSGNTTGNYLSLAVGTSIMGSADKAQGQSVRCLRDNLPLTVPVLNTVSGLNDVITASTVQATTMISFDGGAAITARGFCWNTIGNPTLSDNKMSDSGNGTGSYTGTLTGLSANTLYYVSAYATNSKGTGYGVQSTFKVCPAFTVIHIAGINGAPVSKTVTYKSVSTDVTGVVRCWITQNLGSDQQATSATDNSEASSGWYWQFNRSQGYMHDGTTLTPFNGFTPWPVGVSENIDWLISNDPCDQLLGSGWRLPTIAEWTKADASPQNWNSAADVYGSVLKLHNAGSLAYLNGGVSGRGTAGNYWSSTQMGINSNPYYGYGYFDGQYYSGSGGSIATQSKTFGYPVRCLFDETGIVIAKASVSNANIPTSTMTGTTAEATATVTLEHGSTVTDRGLCWNTTGAPPTIITDHVISKGTGTGSFIGTLTGLTEGPTYYVWAYATNSRGTAYSAVVSSFKICPTAFTVIHTGGLNGAPVDKTVTYSSVSSTISGSAACWLTQNLGATQQAASSTDASEASAGWYWQFNNMQGYQFTSTRTPATTWITSNPGTTDWLAANDPCRLLLGTGWRIPTSVEWTAVNAQPQYWQNSADAYASVLKLHNAGYLLYSSGIQTSPGSIGYYWSSTQHINGTTGYYLSLSGSTTITSINKPTATPLRCIR